MRHGCSEGTLLTVAFASDGQIRQAILPLTQAMKVDIFLCTCEQRIVPFVSKLHNDTITETSSEARHLCGSWLQSSSGQRGVASQQAVAASSKRESAGSHKIPASIW